MVITKATVSVNKTCRLKTASETGFSRRCTRFLAFGKKRLFFLHEIKEAAYGKNQKKDEAVSAGCFRETALMYKPITGRPAEQTRWPYSVGRNPWK